MKKTKEKRTEKESVGIAGQRKQPTDTAFSGGNSPSGQSLPEEASEATANGSGTDAAAVEQTQEESVESLKARVAALEESCLRAKADCRNIQRRAAIERADAVVYANTGLMRSLLGVLDDFERSLEAAPANEQSAPWVEGIELVHANLLKALTEHGLERIEALHQPFDPNLHEAMMQQASREHAPGTVLQEVAKGYRMRERIIRPVKVIVSKSVEDADEMPIDETAEARADEAGT